MGKRPLLAAVAAAFFATGAAAATRALPAKLTLDGIGGVRPGMSVAQVEARWGVALRLDRTLGSRCAPATVRAGAMAGYTIFLDGRFGAAFFRKGAASGTGIRIGSTLAHLRSAYGRLLTSVPNKYVPGGRDYYVRRARAPHWELRFNVSPEGRVVEMAFGNRAVRLVEGCA